MIVKCVENKIDKVCTGELKEVIRDIYGRISGEDENLRIGCFHVVYSLFEADGIKWYLIRFDSAILYPLWFPEHFFEVVDDKLSKYWIKSNQSGVGCAPGPGILYSFKEYTDDFYYNLVDGREEEVGVFNNIADKIRLEAIL